MKSEFELSLLNDFYEFTMSNGFFCEGKGEQIVYFDVFFRRIPDRGGYAICCGLDQVIDYISNLSYSDEVIEFLREKGIFSEGFLEYLRNFKFSCDVYAVPEGTPVFPGEPILVVRGPAIQAQLLETMILLTLNHQSLIATKASRIVRAADGRGVSEFGARRAHGTAASVMGARAAYIAGCAGTSNTLCDKLYGVPSSGTMAHSWVQSFPSEYEAFAAYARNYPKSCVLLIDTFNVLKSGLPNAIRCFNEVLKPMGCRPVAVRIDSGDITYLSKKIRAILDEAGYTDCKIMVSNSLDEYIIRDCLNQGAKIDLFGVGERLITSRSESVFGGVYKIVAVEEADGSITPKIKISENIEKITTPCFKQVYRLFSNDTGKAIADLITLHDEEIDQTKPYTLFDPVHTWKKQVVSNYKAVPLLELIFKEGELVYKKPSTKEIRDYSLGQMDLLWDEVKRFENPHEYYVDYSQKLWEIKNNLLKND